MKHGSGSRLLLAVFLAGSGAALVAPPSVAARTTPEVLRAPSVDSLHRGADARVDWFHDNLVRTAEGKTVKLPWTERAARRSHLRLIGRVSGGWLVKTFSGDTWTVWLVSHGKKTHLSEAGVYEGLFVSHGVSDDDLRYFTDTYDEVDSDLVEIADLDGSSVASHSFDDGEVLSFSGSEAVIGETGTQKWDLTDDTLTPLGVDASAANINDDLLFVRNDDGESGPTSLSSPADPTWTATMEQIVVSPGGSTLVSRTESGGDELEVRDVASGELLQSYGFRWIDAAAPVWESDQSFVFIGLTAAQTREALVRCRVAGGCVRASAFLPEGSITLPGR